MLRHYIAISAFALTAPAFAQETPPADPQAAIATAIQADWSKFDQGAKGYLTEAEFSTWLTALKTQSGSVEDAGKTAKWTQDSFKISDTNIDNQIDPAELTAFLKSQLKPR